MLVLAEDAPGQCRIAREETNAREIVGYVGARTPGLAANTEVQAEFFADVYFGLLAGIFERRSGKMKPGLRHPAIWNALCVYRQAADKEAEGSGEVFTEEQKLVRLATPFLGYAKGREPSMSTLLLFTRW